MTVTAPETKLRQDLIALLESEFGAEALTVYDDRIHDSLGQEGPVAGVYPETSPASVGDALVLEPLVKVQLFRRWSREVNAEQAVSPAGIEEWAERLRRAVRSAGLGTPGDAHLWYYQILRIDYPPDPTGNITRLIATVQGTTQNAGLTETAG